MSEADLQSALRLALEIAATAQVFATADFRRTESRKKPDGSEVTDTDLRIEQMTLERIRGAFPEHALLAEEDSRQPPEMPAPQQARYCWVVDPLDGTRNYSRRLPCFTTSIGLLDEGWPVLAVTRDLVTGAGYWAVRGQGAHCAGRVLRVADRLFERHSLVSFQPADDGETYERAPWFRRVHLRNFGTTALHLALVADGCLDGAICEHNRLWDVAAGALLVREAGGVITRLDGGNLLPFDLAHGPRAAHAFLAGSPAAHSAMLAGMCP